MTTVALSLELEPRQTLGKKVKQLRREGMIPVHLYGPGMEPCHLQCEVTRLLRLLSQAEEGKPIAISIAGEKEPILAYAGEVQWNPRSDQLLHVDFVRVREG